MQTSLARNYIKRIENDRIWLSIDSAQPDLKPHSYEFNVLPDEFSVGKAMFNELVRYSSENARDISIVLLGGRGAQAMYRIIREKAETNEIDDLLGRLHVFTQDALAPMRMDNSLSFVRDFERLLGSVFFQKIKSFTPMQTATDDLEREMHSYLEKLEQAGGIDIFFIGMGPEANDASHICYIKPNSGARATDIAGIIPISGNLVEHHISKFKAGGSVVPDSDEAECRTASKILTLGPAALLGARLIVQSIVDASTAPAKVPCFARLRETELSDDPQRLVVQLDENPGLWVRTCGNVKTFILSDLLGERA